MQQDSFEMKTSTHIQAAIGQRLYPDPQIAIVELVSNSYDADADVVNVDVSASTIVVSDDGWGMNKEALSNFFTIGKSVKPASQKERKPIGNFGIGKFAILSMADTFAVLTKTADYYAKATYSHEDALASGEFLNDYQIPVEEYSTEEEYRLAFVDEVGNDEYYDEDGTGVTIVMHNLHREYSDQIVKQKLAEMLVPQAADDFDIFVNGEKIEERYIHGIRYDISIDSPYGSIVGEIVIAADSVELADQAGIQVQVQGRGLYRTYFDLYDYDVVAKRLSGHVVADWLNPLITSDRTGLIDSPQKTTFEKAVRDATRSILDQEASKRATANEEHQKQVLDRAVRTVTSILNKLPEFDFPKRPLQSMVPVGALDDLFAGKDPSVQIDPAGGTEATITANLGNRALNELLDFIKEIASDINVNPTELPSEIRTISQAGDAIEKLLGRPLEELLGREALEELLGQVPEEQVADEQIKLGAINLAAKRLQEVLRRIFKEEDIATSSALLVDGVTIHTPITNALELTKMTLSPIAPPQDVTNLDLMVTPFEEGYAPDAPQAQINNFIAASVEHLGGDGPASMMAEGFGFDGVQIYINADHPVYQSIEQDNPNMLAFYQAQLIFGEVVLMQNFGPREALDKQAELMRILVTDDRKILKFKG